MEISCRTVNFYTCVCQLGTNGCSLLTSFRVSILYVWQVSPWSHGPSRAHKNALKQHNTLKVYYIYRCTLRWRLQCSISRVQVRNADCCKVNVKAPSQGHLISRTCMDLLRADMQVLRGRKGLSPAKPSHASDNPHPDAGKLSGAMKIMARPYA